MLTSRDVKILRALLSCISTVVVMVLLLRCTLAVWSAFVDSPAPGSYSFATAILSGIVGWWISGVVMRGLFPVVTREVTPDEEFIRNMTRAMEGPDGVEPPLSA
jgi:hypothetical protein